MTVPQNAVKRAHGNDKLRSGVGGCYLLKQGIDGWIIDAHVIGRSFGLRGFGAKTLKQGNLPAGTRHASDLAHAVDQILIQAV
jgi:hypothetical protein